MTSDDPVNRKVVYVIDDNAEVRKSLHFAMESAGIRVWPFGSPEDFLDAIETLSPAPILLDVRMPKIDGVQLLRILRDRGIDWPVIMMTAHGEIQIAVSTMKLGAFDFIEKPFDLDDLEQLLTGAFARLETVVSTARRREDALAKLAQLSPRERDVAHHLAQGKSSKMIGIDLGISHRTVEIHRSSVLAKLGVTNAAGVVRVLVEADES